MDINMIDDLNDVLEERGEEFRARVHITVKPHALLKGICLEKEGNKVAPTVYLEGHEEDTVEEYATFCQKAYHANSSMKEDMTMNIDKWVTAEYINGNVLPRLTHQDNLDRLNRNDTYYIRMLDLVVFFYIPVCKTDNGYEGTITITNPLIKSAGINAPDLYETAVKNLEKSFEIKSMYETLNEMMPGLMDDEDDEPVDDAMLPRMYVATNESKVNGASVILTQRFKDIIKTLFGDKAIIIPSSRHEVIVVDYSDQTAKETAKMIQEVNRTEVSAEDILSDHPYFLINGDIYQHDLTATH